MDSGQFGVLKPAGPFRIATELRLAGFSTQCVDIGPLRLGVKPSNLEILIRIIKKFITAETLWIGISTTYMDDLFGIRISKNTNVKSEILESFIDQCRQINPKIKFITGGSRIYSLGHYGFYTFAGPADKDIVEFTHWCKDSSYNPNIHLENLTVKCKEYDQFVTSKIIWQVEDIIFKGESLPIEISRGCIFKCKFCAFPLNGKTKGEWIKHANILLAEFLRNYELFGTTDYIFSDDTYNDSVEKLEFLYSNVYSQLPFKLTFTTYLRLDLLYRFKQTEDILKNSGLKSAIFGLETLDNNNAKIIGKGMNVEKQLDYLHVLKEDKFKDILIGSGFIAGLPYDTKESLLAMKEFLLSEHNPLDNWIVNPLQINPGHAGMDKSYYSEFDKESEKYGYTILDDDPSLFPGVNWELRSNNLNYYDCQTMAKETNNLSAEATNFKFGAFAWPRILTIIQNQSDLLELNRRSIINKYDLGKMIHQRNLDYYDRLFKI